VRYWVKRLLELVYTRLNSAHLVGEFQRRIREGWVEVGRHSYGTPQVHVWPNGGKLKIGHFTSIADEVHILLGGDHPTDWVTTFPLSIRLGLAGAWQDGMPSTKGDVVVGSDVWIGHGVTILSGVRIGHGAIVTARSLVVKDVEPYAIVGGIPAKEIRKRFSARDIERLLAVRWWEWPDERVSDAVALLSGPDLSAFLAAHESGAATDSTR
jgi:acetyltransferase-like isoleucine patch superfamily enzyme